METFDLTGLIALLISAATLIVVLAQERRHRLRATPAYWTSSVSGTVTRGDHEETWRFASLSQDGSHSVILHSVFTFNCKPHLTPEHRLKSFVFKPGDSVDLEFESDNPEIAWLLITWSSIDDRTKGAIEWVPLMTDGPLAEKQFEQRRSEPIRRWLRRVWPKESEMLRKVGPDYYPWRIQPTTPRKRMALQRMRGELFQEEAKSAQGVISR